MNPDILAAQIAHLAADNASLRAQIQSIVTTAGGIVEGEPTGSHNILQRIRELKTIEEYAAEEHWLPYWLGLAKDTSVLTWAIDLAQIGAGKTGYRSYAGCGSLYCGDATEGPAEATFVDWGLARATEVILNAVIRGELVPRSDLKRLWHFACCPFDHCEKCIEDAPWIKSLHKRLGAP